MKPMESIHMAREAREALLSKKGTGVVILDVRKISPVTDYYVIASGVTAPQLKAMSSAVHRHLKESGVRFFRQSGMPDDGWVVLDFVDVVIHMFLQEIRDYYAIEELWADAPQVS
jgi:ribosome-associated protein